jgi:hypothetical protein
MPNRFGEVLGLKVCCFFDVGDGAGYFEDAVVGGSLVVAESWRGRASAGSRGRARRKCGCGGRDDIKSTLEGSIRDVT